MAWGTMGSPFEGASMNPCPRFEPDVAIGNLSTWRRVLIGELAGALIAVGVATYVLRGPAKAQEARAAQGTPWTGPPPDRPGCGLGGALAAARRRAGRLAERGEHLPQW